MSNDDNDEIGALLKAAMKGEMTVDEAADRLRDLGVKHIDIKSVMPEGQSKN